MPMWLLNFLVSMAVKVGVPYLMKQFPWLPSSLAQILDELIADLKNPQKSNSAAKKMALSRIKSRGTVGIPTDLK